MAPVEPYDSALENTVAVGRAALLRDICPLCGMVDDDMHSVPLVCTILNEAKTMPFATVPSRNRFSIQTITARPEDAPLKCAGKFLVLGLVHQLVLGNPRHHGAQFLADLFDLVIVVEAARRLE